MLNHQVEGAIPIELVTDVGDAWLDQQEARIQNWVRASGFKARPGTVCLLAGATGQIEKVLLGVEGSTDFLSAGALPVHLTEGVYTFEAALTADQQSALAYGWLLGAYQFDRYKAGMPRKAMLAVSDDVNIETLEALSKSITLVRDLINTPTEAMGPPELEAAIQAVAKEFSAECHSIVGEALLEQNYPMIHAVGRASAQAPRLVDLRWGDPNHPKLTLVGKGVCFDSGGLNLKPANGMRHMKKDMSGAAHVLGLARMIMSQNLPVRLRMLCPVVENAVSGSSYRPGDILSTRKGISVEVTNTDAEGRLILGDALYEAASENPDLLIDIATLTGAARVALGEDISALFTEDVTLATALQSIGDQLADPIWPLPMYEPYRKQLESPVADMVNAHLGSGFGGAITAALFLSEFVPKNVSWAHFDVMAWNTTKSPGRPKGAEAMAIRALFEYLRMRYT